MPVLLGFCLFNGCNKICNHGFVIRRQAGKIKICLLNGGKIHNFNHMVNHSLEAHVCSILGGIYLGHAVCFQFFDLFWYDDTAAAAKNFDM